MRPWSWLLWLPRMLPVLMFSGVLRSSVSSLCPPLVPSTLVCRVTLFQTVPWQFSQGMQWVISMGSWMGRQTLSLLLPKLGKVVIFFRNYFLTSKRVLTYATSTGFLQECCSRAEFHLPGMVSMVAQPPLSGSLGRWALWWKNFSGTDPQSSKRQPKKCNHFEWKPF